MSAKRGPRAEDVGGSLSTMGTTPLSVAPHDLFPKTRGEMPLGGSYLSWLSLLPRRL